MPDDFIPTSRPVSDAINTIAADMTERGHASCTITPNGGASFMNHNSLERTQELYREIDRLDGLARKRKCQRKKLRAALRYILNLCETYNPDEYEHTLHVDIKTVAENALRESGATS